MTNYYADAIDILANEKTDFKALAYEIAKANPKVVTLAAKRIYLKGGWQKQCLQLIQAGQKIEAIKLCREATGMGLAESKAAVEALVE